MAAAMTRDLPVVAVAGMAFEARIAAGPGVRIVYGQDRTALRKQIEACAHDGASGIVSFGTAGGLAPGAAPGDAFIATGVLTPETVYPASLEWSQALAAALPYARRGTIWGATAPVMTVAAKQALWMASGASLVDMESGLAAEIAVQFGLPFVVLRVVIDPAHRTVPPLALAGVTPHGATNPWAVTLALLKQPLQLPALIRLAGDARKANRSLLRSRQALGCRFGLPDIG